MKKFPNGYIALYKLLKIQTVHVIVTKSEALDMLEWLFAHTSSRTKLNVHDKFVDRLVWFSTIIDETEVAMPMRHFIRFKEHVEESAGGAGRVSDSDQALLVRLFECDRRTITGAEVLAIRLRALIGGNHD